MAEMSFYNRLQYFLQDICRLAVLVGMSDLAVAFIVSARVVYSENLTHPLKSSNRSGRTQYQTVSNRNKRTMDDITIRHSSPADAELIKRVHEGPIAYSGTLQLPYPSPVKWQKRISELPPGFYSLVAEIRGDIVGHAGLEIHANPRRRHAGTFGIAVKDAHQGKGVGGKLMVALIDLADNWLNLIRLELTVFSDNESALALYKKHGFVIEGESPYYAFRNGDYVSVYQMARIKVSSGLS